MSASTTVASKVVEVNGVSLSYRESGEGEPLVLVHGHISDQRSWIDLEHKLATRFHVFNYSRRYAWPNKPIKDDQRAPWEQDAFDLAAFIETLNIGPVHVLANSSGAVNSLYIARRKPHLFRTLLVEEPPLTGLFLPTFPPPLIGVLSFLLWHPITFWPVTYFGATTMGPTVAHCKKGEYDQATEVFCAGVMGPKFWPRIQTNPDRLRQVEDNAKWLCHFFRYDTLPKYVAEDAQSTKVPTLVMAGKDSSAHQRYTSHELHRVSGASRKRVAYIENAGHLMHEDNPDGVFDEVVRFVFGDDAALYNHRQAEPLNCAAIRPQSIHRASIFLQNNAEGMSLPCPYRHVSYATWRLDVIRTLCQSFDAPHSRPSALLRRENQRPYLRSASISRSATKSGDNANAHDGSTPALPSVTDADKKDTRTDGPFSPYSESGRRAIRELLSDLKKASKKIRSTNENGESYRFGSHKSLTLDQRGYAITQDNPEQSPSIDLPLRKYHSTQGESLDASIVEGQQALKDLLTELQEVGKDIHRGDGKEPSSHRPEGERPPTRQSPIIARVAQARRQQEERKQHPSYRRIKGLKNNLWAEVLASPLRACQGSGARLPSDLLLDFGYVKNQKDGKIYLMPADLADVDALEAELGAELAMLEGRSRTLDGGTEGKRDTISTIKAGDADGSAGSSTEASQNTAEHMATARRYIPVQSRLLSNITFLRLVTDKVTQPTKKTPKVPAPTTSETRPGEVGKLIHFDTRESFSTAHHYLQNKHRFDSTVGGQDAVGTNSASPAAGQAKARFNLNKLQWQPDIYLRVAEIMRRRILAALKLLADSESTARSQPLPARPSATIALPPPRDGMFSGEELRRLMRAKASSTSSTGLKIRAVASEPKEGSASNAGGSAAASDADVSEPAQSHAPFTTPEAEYHVLGHSEWLPGSIFLRIGNADDAIPDPLSSSLPPLPSNNPLIPPMVTVLDTYRFPVFSLQQLFTNASAPGASDLQELNTLIRRESIFQHPHQLSSGKGDDTGGNLVLIRPIPGPAKAVVEEVWRLWRYLGGRNMDWSFASGTGGE